MGSSYPLKGGDKTMGSPHPLKGGNKTMGSSYPLKGGDKTTGIIIYLHLKIAFIHPFRDGGLTAFIPPFRGWGQTVEYVSH